MPLPCRREVCEPNQAMAEASIKSSLHYIKRAQQIYISRGVRRAARELACADIYLRGVAMVIFYSENVVCRVR